MQHCDTVDAEGGPILIADAGVAQSWSWRGSDSDRARSKFQRACDLLAQGVRAATIPIDDKFGLLWDMQGAGTCDVYRDDPGNVLVVRAWLDETGFGGADETAALRRLADVPRSSGPAAADISVSCGVLTVLWSAETGECIQSLAVDGIARPSETMMSQQGTGLLVAVPNGRYDCYVDKVELPCGDAVRCHLIMSL